MSTSTTFTQGLQNNVPHPPPPYTVNAEPNNYPCFSDRQRTNNSLSSHQVVKLNSKDEPKFLSLMQLGSIIILVLCALSCIIALHRNTKIMEQNLELLGRQLQMLEKNRISTGSGSQEHTRIRRMLSAMDACPPCPTEAPVNPIEPHRNPVSVLNEELGRNAKYTVIYKCENPHIHEATLRILEDPSFIGKSWIGKGRNQQNAKQAAAWDAIQKDLPHLITEVADEYIPDLYIPECQRPTSNFSSINNGTV